ncbi:MAG: NAD-dependent epimerase/dehydratase family protein, partial [Actinobacteria bacterium]
PYPQTKAAGDSAVQRMIVADRLPAVIVRPDQIFGPGDHLHFGRMADRLRAGKGLIVGKGDNALPLVYVDDLVQGLLLALDHDRAVGQAYNIGNDRPLSQAQLLRAPATFPPPLPRSLCRRVPRRAPRSPHAVVAASARHTAGGGVRRHRQPLSDRQGAARVGIRASRGSRRGRTDHCALVPGSRR